MGGKCSIGLQILIRLIISLCVSCGSVGVGRVNSGQDCTVDADCADAGEICETAPSGSTSATGKVCKNKVCTTEGDCSAILGTTCLDDLRNSPQKSCQIVTTTPTPIQTPMVRYSGLGVKHGAACRSAPNAILEIQNSDASVEDKQKIFDTAAAATPENFDHPVCNWKVSRLQCVPNREQAPSTTSGKAVYPLGTCQCLLEMGAKTIWVDNSYTSKKTGNLYGQCFIPASLGQHSKCGDHNIVIPSGQIDTGHDVQIFVGKSSNFCTPGAECRTGYNYVGTQCSCKKGYTLVKSSATCKGEGDGSPRTEITFILLFLPFVNATFILIKSLPI